MRTSLYLENREFGSQPGYVLSGIGPSQGVFHHLENGYKWVKGGAAKF